MEAKNEVIETLKGSLQSKEGDVAQLHAVISDLTQQLKTTTQQNDWLTNLLVAPKHETEPMRSSKVTDISDEITDFTDEITDEDTQHIESEDNQNTSTEEMNQEQHVEESLADDAVPASN